MKKFLLKTLSFTLALCLSTALSYAYFSTASVVDKEYTLSVETPEGLTMTESSNNGKKLAPITVSSGTFVDQNGNASDKYYEVVYTVETSKAKALKLTDIEVDSDLGNAIRVQTELNGSAREFAPSGRTATNQLGDSIGVVNKNATLTVRIYLDGTDADCIDENIADSLNVTLSFAI